MELILLLAALAEGAPDADIAARARAWAAAGHPGRRGEGALLPQLGGIIGALTAAGARIGDTTDPITGAQLGAELGAPPPGELGIIARFDDLDLTLFIEGEWWCRSEAGPSAPDVVQRWAGAHDMFIIDDAAELAELLGVRGVQLGAELRGERGVQLGAELDT